MTNILITGATGFIGRHLISTLINIKKKINLNLVIRDDKKKNRHFLESPNIKKIIFTKDLFLEDVNWWKKQCKDIDIVIHLAWYVEHGLYLESPRNIDCLIGSLKLAKGAAEAGVKKFVGIGTCFEYDLSQGVLSIDTPLKPITTYANTKTALYLSLSRSLPAQKVEFAWCRLFYIYGQGEDHRRLTSYLHSRLKSKKIARLTSGKKIRDFLDVVEVANRIIKIAIGNQTGPVNICSGIPITIRQYAEQIANEYGRLDLLQFGSRTSNLTDPPRVIGVSNIK
jgi:dTDP-6-deoxy-L-talose 4-dehydrogenase (NAD+)